ncbi:PREDICTED: centromere/kinetochore protein zw10 homolog [Nicrophorus vespilloides]|uniref:Centromere/kinetochore protein zw10 homolog n=1 Tax=Nicrophorus vespilloides TaxID=110193 RepID=A0ABM1M9B6_NICVS|nr:PREDICTED: centromere/kinetochore protein zw10 homolog [Nicrophorus vespilloides]XP_017771167.1 PREDICTED: centromere/kinetochore protein zw10 homolog [Nicrophorus vespilloides]
MSLVQEVLSSFEAANMEKVNNNLPKLISESLSLKMETVAYLEETYKNYFSRQAVINNLQTKCNILIEQQTELKDSITVVVKKDANKAKLEVLDCSKKQDEINLNLMLCSHLLSIYSCISKITKCQSNKEYLRCVEELEMNESKLSEIKPEYDEIELLTNLSMEFTEVKVNLIERLCGVVNNHIQYSVKDVGSGIMMATINIRERNDEVEEALKALAKLEERITPLDDLIYFIWEHIYSKIVNHSTDLQIEKSDEGGVQIILKFNSEHKDSYSDVFKQIIKVSELLDKHFNCEIKENITILDYVGEDIRDNLSELIIKFCLNDTIPSNEEGLKKYNEVIAATELLQQKLIQTHIFLPETKSILKHAQNIDVHFINKKCKEYLSSAVDLMKEDLHDTVQVGKESDALVNDEFPQSSVSKSVLKLVDLVEKILISASTSSELCAGRLYTTCKNIIYLYGPAICEHHHKLLKSIPQQIAIFYNNCMYMNHEFGLKKWNALLMKLPPSIRSAPFDLGQHSLQCVANDKFEDYVQAQIAQIEKTVNESGILDLMFQQKIEVSTEKAVRQCLRQLELLKTVWQKILNYYMYNKTIGVLLNSLAKTIVTCILTVQDISATGSEQLVDILKVVQARGPKLFTESGEIHMYVDSWDKLYEMGFVLKSNMLDINDRWADGKGPLALHFTADEMKHLIKALFANSDMRAKMLAQIKK